LALQASRSSLTCRSHRCFGVAAATKAIGNSDCRGLAANAAGTAVRLSRSSTDSTATDRSHVCPHRHLPPESSVPRTFPRTRPLVYHHFTLFVNRFHRLFINRNCQITQKREENRPTQAPLLQARYLRRQFRHVTITHLRLKAQTATRRKPLGARSWCNGQHARLSLRDPEVNLILGCGRSAIQRLELRCQLALRSERAPNHVGVIRAAGIV